MPVYGKLRQIEAARFLIFKFRGALFIVEKHLNVG